jgi:hypothetical protein
MVERLMRVSILAIAIAGVAVLAYAADDKLAEDNFLTNTINSVFDKVGKVTSGEEGIFIKDYNKPDRKAQDYTTDALGRKIAEPTIRSTGALPPSKDEKAKAAADKKAE